MPLRALEGRDMGDGGQFPMRQNRQFNRVDGREDGIASVKPVAVQRRDTRSRKQQYKSSVAGQSRIHTQR